MIDLETRLGPATLRVWGLIANFTGNAALLYGAIGYVADGSRLFVASRRRRGHARLGPLALLPQPLIEVKSPTNGTVILHTT